MLAKPSRKEKCFSLIFENCAKAIHDKPKLVAGRFEDKLYENTYQYMAKF